MDKETIYKMIIEKYEKYTKSYTQFDGYDTSYLTQISALKELLEVNNAK